jgi:hypothetical protein
MSYLFSYFYVEAETNRETPEINMKTDSSRNKHGANTAQTRTKSG